ncbi:MAG: ABC transporter ATP-binding protein [Actinomycetota bacterium]|jgi:ABC-2 type transport system ATP-binding protein
MLSLTAVAKRYKRGPWVVRDVSVDVTAGAVIRVDGRNGSGKSTLLRVLAGVTRPSRGTVHGRVATAYVPERFNAALPLTVRQYLTHLGRVHGVAGPDIDEAIDDWSARFGLTPFIRWPMASLSKGTAQKVALVQGFMARPPVLVLDEAATGLDRAARVALREAVGERQAAGAATVFVDHDPAAMAGLVTERWVVEASRVERRTDPAAAARADGTTMLIEVAGPRVAELLSATYDGLQHARLLESGAVELAVDAGSSDEVLRLVLDPALGLRVRRVEQAGR